MGKIENKKTITSTKTTIKVIPKTPTKKTTNFSLPSKVFGVKVNTQSIFDTILSERASRRQGTHKVKHRNEVRGGGRKPFAQKHTGKARAGSTRSPIWVGGGVTFGPTPERNYNLKVNKKLRKLAFLSSLTLKAKNKAVIINEIKMEKISTKELIKKLSLLKLKESFKKLLIVSNSKILYKSANNLQKVEVQKLSGLNIEKIVNADAMIISKNDVKKIEGMVE